MASLLLDVVFWFVFVHTFFSYSPVESVGVGFCTGKHQFHRLDTSLLQSICMASCFIFLCAYKIWCKSYSSMSPLIVICQLIQHGKISLTTYHLRLTSIGSPIMFSALAWNFRFFLASLEAANNDAATQAIK